MKTLMQIADERFKQKYDEMIASEKEYHKREWNKLQIRKKNDPVISRLARSSAKSFVKITEGRRNSEEKIDLLTHVIIKTIVDWEKINEEFNQQFKEHD